MKILIGLFVIIVFVLVVLLSNFYPDKIMTPTPEEAPQGYHLRFGHNMPENSALHQAALHFAALVKQRSGGQVDVEVFPSQQLGNDQQMIEMARAGELDVILTPTAKLSPLVPEMQYVDLPFLFPQREDAYALLDGEVGRLLLDHLTPYGLLGVTFWENGFKHFTANRPIRTPDDFHDLKIRTMKSKVIMDQYRVLGAAPVTIGFHYLYQALKDGVVDGQENPLVVISGMKLYEVQSHLILSAHSYLSYVFSLSDRSKKKLPLNIQELLVKAAREITPWERAETQKKEDGFLQSISESGVIISTLSPKERGELQEATRGIAYKYRYVIGDDIMSATERYLQGKYGPQKQKNDILIGLSADLSLGSARAGMAIKRGMELAVAEINKKDGISGKRLSIVVLDHEGIVSRAKQNFITFTAMENLVAVIGGKQGFVALAESKLARKHELPYLVPWAAVTDIIDPALRGNYTFRLSARDDEVGKFLIDEAMKVSPKIGLLLVNNVWGRSNEKAMTDALATRGLAPTVIAWFDFGDKDMSPQLNRLQTAGVGVILLAANAIDGSYVVKSLAQRGKKTPIISHWGITGGYFWEETQKELDDVDVRFLQTKWFGDAQESKRSHFFQAYETSYKEKISLPAGSVHAYDLVNILALAVEKAGCTDRSAIRNVLENIDFYQGVLKNYQPPFSPQNHEALDRTDFCLMRYDNKGRITTIPVEVK